MVKVKICGITNIEDALCAVECGADALGFIFADSPRRIAPEQAKQIISQLPKDIYKVGVFVDARRDKVEEIAAFCGLNVLQFHGSERPAYCDSFNYKKIKAFPVKDENFLYHLGLYKVDAFLLDTYSPVRAGGTGQVFNWELALKAKNYGKIILAGGLEPNNIRRAVEMVEPYGVDVSSGVEAHKRKKDHEKVQRFIAEAKETIESEVRVGA